MRRWDLGTIVLFLLTLFWLTADASGQSQIQTFSDIKLGMDQAMVIAAMERCCIIKKQEVVPAHWIVSDKGGKEIGYIDFRDSKVEGLTWPPKTFEAITAHDLISLMFSSVAQQCRSAPEVAHMSSFVIDGGLVIQADNIDSIDLQCGHYTFRFESDADNKGTISMSEEER